MSNIAKMQRFAKKLIVKLCKMYQKPKFLQNMNILKNYVKLKYAKKCKLLPKINCEIM